MAKPKACKCRALRRRSSCKDEINYSCECGQLNHTLRMSKRQYKKHIASMLKPSEIHRIFHDFQRKFNSGKADGPNVFSSFKYSGYPMMEAVRKWAKKHPSVIIIGCDDDFHAGSDLVLIPHEDKYQLWGVTVLYIPQCTGEKPIRFFLYPGHLQGLLEGLNKMANLCRSKGNRLLDSCWNNPKERDHFDWFPKSVSRKKALEQANAIPGEK